MTTPTRPVSATTRRQARIVVAVVAGMGALVVLLVAAAALSGGQHTATSSSAPAGHSDAAAGDSLAVKQLGAEMYVTSQNYQAHLSDGDARRATSDHETLLGDCDTARTLGLGSGQESQAIRTVCQTLGAPVP